MKVLARLRAWPWPDIGAVAAVVVVGASQIFFSLILQNAGDFPKEAGFHLAVLLWTVLVPFGIVLGLDRAITGWTGRGRLFAAWRAALYTFLFASCLRQIQVYYPAPFLWFLERFPPRVPLYGLLALVFLLALRSRVLVHRYAAALGLLAAMLTASYLYSSGLLGSAWARSRHAPPASAVGWKGGPIVVVLFDELSGDILLKNGRIDPALYPNLAALEAEGARFPRALANHAFTKDALPCLLTGRLFPKEGEPRLFDFLPADCAVVGRTFCEVTYRGLKRHARASDTFLLYGRAEPPLTFTRVPGALAHLFRETPFSRSPFGPTPSRRIVPALMPAPEGPEALHRGVDVFLDGLKAPALEGRLTFWHCPFPHFPFIYNPDGSAHGHPATEFEGSAVLTQRPVAENYDSRDVVENYRKQVGYADQILGRLVGSLKREGLYERTTLIVTSDHGLRTWGSIGPSPWPHVMAGDIARVPMLLRGPQVRPGTYDVDYQHVDFTPTVLDALGIPFPAGAFEGRSGFATSRQPPERERAIFTDSGGRLLYDAATDAYRRAGR